jgi:hypothetical protein
MLSIFDCESGSASRVRIHACIGQRACPGRPHVARSSGRGSAHATPLPAPHASSEPPSTAAKSAAVHPLQRLRSLMALEA